MPELPEVEVVKRSLVNKIQNSIVKAVKINDGRLRYRVDKNKIKKIIGLRIKKISRRSKFLLFFFNNKSIFFSAMGSFLKLNIFFKTFTKPSSVWRKMFELVTAKGVLPIETI